MNAENIVIIAISLLLMFYLIYACCVRRNFDMTLNGWLQILLYFAVILLLTKPMGVFMAKVFSRERTWLDPVLRPVEKLLYKLTRVDEDHEMRWTEYCIAMLLFSAVSMLVLYLLERTQQWLPFNPQKFPAVPADLALEHCCLIYYQHQLAVLYRRAGHELSHADGGSGVS